MESNGKYVAFYMRVSSRQQNIESQLPELQAYAKDLEELGERVVWIEDTFTGRQMERPGIQQIAHDIDAGRIKTLVCWRLDRLGRTARGLCNLFADCQRLGVNVISLRDRFDLSTPIGRLQAHILASVAEFETELRRERQAAGLAALRAKLQEIKRLHKAGWTYDAMSRKLKLSPEAIQKVVTTGRMWFGGRAKGQGCKPVPPAKDILTLLRANMSNKQIARACNVCFQTLYDKYDMKALRRQVREERRLQKAKIA